jgi:hypothetical protein
MGSIYLHGQSGSLKGIYAHQYASISGEAGECEADMIIEDVDFSNRSRLLPASAMRDCTKAFHFSFFTPSLASLVQLLEGNETLPEALPWTSSLRP